MIPRTVQDIAAIVGGLVHGDRSRLVTGPATLDSREVETGGLFAAFVGEHVDGHDYVGAAATAGAAAVLGTRPTELPTVVVDDPQGALQRLAADVLAQLRRDGELTVVALTGSQGKTSTKDLLAAVLEAVAPTVATRGSFNNELGLPLTVLRATPATRYLVVEMGARGIGHLADLCAIAPPDVSLVLNVGKAHLGEFGSQQAIAQAKGELVEALSPEGTAVLNADDPLVAAMAARTRARVLRFGESAGEVRIDGLQLDEQGRARFSLVHGAESAAVALGVVGEHQATNAAAAATVAVALGLPLRAAAEALGEVRALSKGRMEVQELSGGLTVINDAYNANPDSMRAGLTALAAIGRARGEQGRTVAVLGEMRELGASSAEEHDAIGRLAVRLGIHQLVVVGEAARPTHLGAHQEGSWGEESVFVRDNDEALAWLNDHLAPGDVVLVKASRGARLDVVADGIAAAWAARGDAS